MKLMKVICMIENLLSFWFHAERPGCAGVADISLKADCLLQRQWTDVSNSLFLLLGIQSHACIKWDMRMSFQTEDQWARRVTPERRGSNL
jgi:hypothetical protein